MLYIQNIIYIFCPPMFFLHFQTKRTTVRTNINPNNTLTAIEAEQLHGTMEKSSGEKKKREKTIYIKLDFMWDRIIAGESFLLLMSTWKMDLRLYGAGGVVVLDSAGEAAAGSLLHSHSAADSIEVIRTSDCLWRSSREELSLSVQPQHLRLRIPACRLTLQHHSSTLTVQPW